MSGKLSRESASFQTGLASVTPLHSAFYRQYNITVGLLRIDLLHPQISGNKWFKLLPLLQRLESGERPRVLSFGGVWSNHLHALAYVGNSFGIRTLGMVRGHPAQASTAMLEDAQRWGMQLVYLSRDEYRDRDAPAFLATLAQEYLGWEVLPEGGSNADAVQGCRTIWQSVQGSDWSAPDYFVCAMGTGGTLAGVIAGKPSRTQVVGVPVLALGDAGEHRVRELLSQAQVSDPQGWCLDHAGAFGGYAKLTHELAAFLLSFECRIGVPLDPVYTLKMMAALNRRVVRGQIAPGSRVLLLHSGGLQGRRGMLSRVETGASAFVGPQLV
ncbi:1-aminocyclopropane-1-carboxylate deaminase [Marinobacterium zhoushanense]|uniref:1-aminocyclopropane-1-carboxylate deaminase n=1 Tax=Marinobacterium zhoushanense TaxID=1679163 RepID=A0ABQ1KIF2_9GAMM|nr:pyridoxal-phosphate dependent enzyme [Marinobacterium zhoushanense]GGB95534.1 1-aminocyclopropane-1-carboxylate deaminase [Marinobacterium zhoushanense]